MIFNFDTASLGHIIALSVRAVLAEHGLEMTTEDQETAGQAAADFLTSVQNHKREQAQMVESVSRDLDDLPVVDPTSRLGFRGLGFRDLGMEPPV